MKQKPNLKETQKEIIDLAARHNKRDLADKAISDGISVEEFRGVLLENISNNTPLETPSEIGMTKEEVREFSLVRAIRAMAKGGADIIFATSFGYMEPMLKVAKEFPNVKFEHATGYKQSKNMASYGLRLYQARHVQGVIAGMMTKTNGT